MIDGPFKPCDLSMSAVIKCRPFVKMRACGCRVRQLLEHFIFIMKLIVNGTTPLWAMDDDIVHHMRPPITTSLLNTYTNNNNNNNNNHNNNRGRINIKALKMMVKMPTNNVMNIDVNA